MTGLVIAPASHAAAKHACLTWHYSQKVPAGKLVKHGVWEDGSFRGVVLYGRGANDRLGRPYGMKQTECVELVRIALRGHTAPVSQIVAVSLGMLRAGNPGLRLVVSYADPKQGHHGGIYQAGNWVYVGPSKAQRELVINGVFTHKRTASAKWGTASPDKLLKMRGVRTVEWAPLEWKHTYLMPLDRAARRRITALGRPYPSAS